VAIFAERFLTAFGMTGVCPRHVFFTNVCNNRFFCAAKDCGLQNRVAAQPVVLPVSAPGGGRTPVLSNPVKQTEKTAIAKAMTVFWLRN